MSARTAICEAIELPAKGAPEWVHLLPRGAVKGRDGRRWRLDDPAAVIARSAKDGDLPIDYDHESEKPKAHGGPLPAAGWIKELQSRADGIWGRVEWTGRATELIAGREYRFLSPVLHYHPVTGQVMRLTGAGLVHRPNLALTALSEQEMTMTAPTTDFASPDLARIADALGLDDSADTDAILTAINAIAAPDPARFVPIEAVADLLKQRNSAASDNARATAEAQVEKAMIAGYLRLPCATGRLRSAPRIPAASTASSPPPSRSMPICIVVAVSTTSACPMPPGPRPATAWRSAPSWAFRPTI